MTALRGLPTDFGYAPAREARLASELALERAVAASCALAAALFVLAFLVRGLMPAAPPAAERFRDPARFADFVVKSWTPPPATHPARPATGAAAVPLPVPDALAPVGAEPDPVASGSAVTGDPGVSRDTPSAGSDPGTVAPATPEPGIWQPVEELPAVATVVSPVYPDLARQAGVEGTVYLWALVDVDGSVREVRVRQSVPLLDGAAVEAVRRWRFTPALNNGKPVPVWVAVPVRFSLH